VPAPASRLGALAAALEYSDFLAGVHRDWLTLVRGFKCYRFGELPSWAVVFSIFVMCHGIIHFRNCYKRLVACHAVKWAMDHKHLRMCSKFPGRTLGLGKGLLS